LNGFILKLDLMDWDLGIFPTEETKSALRTALETASTWPERSDVRCQGSTRATSVSATRTAR
jgi:hypothetical protein